MRQRLPAFDAQPRLGCNRSIYLRGDRFSRIDGDIDSAYGVARDNVLGGPPEIAAMGWQHRIHFSLWLACLMYRTSTWISIELSRSTDHAEHMIRSLASLGAWHPCRDVLRAGVRVVGAARGGRKSNAAASYTRLHLLCNILIRSHAQQRLGSRVNVPASMA